LLQFVAPETLNAPAGHSDVAGVALVDPAKQAYPALQLVHAVAPATLKRPAGHKAAAGAGVVEPAGHA
jgi:hypothetical protein